MVFRFVRHRSTFVGTIWACGCVSMCARAIEIVIDIVIVSFGRFSCHNVADVGIDLTTALSVVCVFGSLSRYKNETQAIFERIEQFLPPLARKSEQRNHESKLKLTRTVALRLVAHYHTNIPHDRPPHQPSTSSPPSILITSRVHLTVAKAMNGEETLQNKTVNGEMVGAPQNHWQPLRKQKQNKSNETNSRKCSSITSSYLPQGAVSCHRWPLLSPPVFRSSFFHPIFVE